jgi:hypothetical protein
MPVDMWTIGFADRLRFPRPLEKRGFEIVGAAG